MVDEPVDHGGGHDGSPKTSPLLTAEEAAEIVGVGKTKMYDLPRVGAVESVRIGRCRRIPHDALAAFVERLREDASGYEVM